MAILKKTQKVKTVDEILATFNDTLLELEAVTNKASNTMESIDKQIASLQEERARVDLESSRASVARRGIQGLLSGEFNKLIAPTEE